MSDTNLPSVRKKRHVETTESDDENNGGPELKKVKKMEFIEDLDAEAKSDPADWPPGDIVQLFEQVEQNLPKSDRLVYYRRVERLDWDLVKFGQYTSTDCATAFSVLIKKVRQFQTVADLIHNMRTMYQRTPRQLQGHSQNEPKKPLSAFFLFAIERRRKLSKKHPELTFAERQQLVTDAYKNLSERKKQKYIDKTKKAMEEYKEQLAIYNEANTVYDGKAPKCQTPFALFAAARMPKIMEKNPDLPHKEANAKAINKWKKLSDKKRLKWIRRSVEAFEQYKVEVADHQRVHPDFIPRSTFLTKQEQYLKDVADGMPEKPSLNGQQVLKRVLQAACKQTGEDPPNPIEAWQKLKIKEKIKYRDQARLEKQAYELAFQKFLATLPEEQQQQVIATYKFPLNTKKRKSPKAAKELEGGLTKNSHTIGPHRSALSYYIEELKNAVASSGDSNDTAEETDLKQKFKELSEEEKEKYRKMAENQVNYKIKTSRKTKRIDLPGQPKRPPIHGYSLFSRHQLKKLRDIPGSERMAMVGHRWQQLTEEEKRKYSEKAKKKLAKYNKAMEVFNQMNEDKGATSLIQTKTATTSLRQTESKPENRNIIVEVDVHRHENAVNSSDNDFVNTRGDFTWMRCGHRERSPTSSLPLKRKSFRKLSSSSDVELIRDIKVTSTWAPKHVAESVVKTGQTDKDVQGRSQEVFLSGCTSQDALSQFSCYIDIASSPRTKERENIALGQVSKTEAASSSKFVDSFSTRKSHVKKAKGSSKMSLKKTGEHAQTTALSDIDVASSPGTKEHENIAPGQVRSEEALSSKIVDSFSTRKSHVNKTERSSKMSLRKAGKLAQTKPCAQDEGTPVGNGSTDSSRRSAPSPGPTKPAGGIRFFRGTYDLFDSFGDWEDLEGVSFYEDDGSLLKISPNIAKALGKKTAKVVLEKVDEPVLTRSFLAVATNTSGVDNHGTETHQDIPPIASTSQASVIECSLEGAFQDGGESDGANMSQILSIKCEPSQSYDDITGNGCGLLQDDQDDQQRIMSSSSFLSTLPPSLECSSNSCSGDNHPSGSTHLTSVSMIEKCRQAFTAIAKPLTLEVAMVVLSSVVVSREEARAIEAATRDQIACDAWYFHRRGRITASNFGNVVIAVGWNEDKKASVVKRVLEDKRYSTSSWGIEHEQTALEAYADVMRNHHRDFKLSRCGFVINPAFPHLGATPDSWVECSCCGRGVVEVKCPSGLPAFKSAKPNRCSFGFLAPHNSTSPLCPNALSQDNAYFYQVQGQMAVCEVDYCDFVCWTSSQIHIERIERDVDLLTGLKADLDSFYVYDVLPTILSDMESARH